MRLVFICLSLGVLIWYLNGHLSTPISPMFLIGFVMVSATIGWRFSEQWHIPGAFGALIIGLIIGQLKVIPPDPHAHMAPLLAFVQTWTGLLLGTALTRTLLTNRRLLQSALLFFIPPASLTFAILIYLHIPLPTALGLAPLAGMSAPLFHLSRENAHSDAFPLSFLTTGLGLVIWGGWYLGGQFPIHIQPQNWILNLFLTGATIEIFVRAYRIVRTEAGQVVSWVLLSLLIVIFCWIQNNNPFAVSLLLGFGFALRGYRGFRFLTHNPFSEMTTAFFIADVAIVFGFHALPAWTSLQVTELMFLGFAMMAGKIAGGLLIRSYFSIPITTWMPLIPIGPIAMLCFAATPNLTPLWPPVVFLIAFGLLPLMLLRPFTMLATKIKSGRHMHKNAIQTTAP